MAAIQRFPKPPIVEAIVDLRVEPRPDIMPSDFDILGAMTDEYPLKREETTEVGVAKDYAMQGALAVNHVFRYFSSNQERIIKSDKDGFSFSRLAPYESWEEMISWAEKGWGIYRNHARPVKVKRIATRYINMINIPEPGIRINDYFNFMQLFPRELAAAYNDFLSRVSFNYPGSTAKVILNLGCLAPLPEKITPMYLDVDAYFEEIHEPDSELIFKRLDELRKIKNEIFDRMITEKAKKLFL